MYSCARRVHVSRRVQMWAQCTCLCIYVWARSRDMNKSFYQFFSQIWTQIIRSELSINSKQFLIVRHIWHNSQHVFNRKKLREKNLLRINIDEHNSASCICMILHSWVVIANRYTIRITITFLLASFVCVQRTPDIKSRTSNRVSTSFRSEMTVLSRICSSTDSALRLDGAVIVPLRRRRVFSTFFYIFSSYRGPIIVRCVMGNNPTKQQQLNQRPKKYVHWKSAGRKYILALNSCGKYEHPMEISFWGSRHFSHSCGLLVL